MDNLLKLRNHACRTWEFLRTVEECDLPTDVEVRVLKDKLETFEATLDAIKRDLPAELQPEPWKFEKIPSLKPFKMRHCKGIYTNGMPCKNQAKDGSLFCGHHETELETLDQIVESLGNQQAES